MVVRVWLHEGHDAESGCEAWALDVLGFATWAPTRAEVLAKLPAKLAEHARWRAKHALFDWNPPYRRFASWADWRKILHAKSIRRIVGAYRATS